LTLFRNCRGQSLFGGGLKEGNCAGAGNLDYVVAGNQIVNQHRLRQRKDLIVERSNSLGIAFTAGPIDSVLSNSGHCLPFAVTN